MRRRGEQKGKRRRWVAKVRGRLYYLYSPSLVALRHFLIKPWFANPEHILPQRNLRCGDAINYSSPHTLSLQAYLVFHNLLSFPLKVIPGISSSSPPLMPSPAKRFQSNKKMWPLTPICRSNFREMKCDQTKRPLPLARVGTVPAKQGSLLLFFSSRVDGSSTALHQSLLAPLNGYERRMTYSPAHLIRRKMSDLSLGSLG